MTLYFARHGESEANVLRVMSNRDIPHGLTPTGRDHARWLADAVSGAGLAHIYASPIPRARETAQIVADTLSVPLTLADGLREFDCGLLEGRGDEAAWAEHLSVQNRWFEGEVEARIEGGESFVDMETRFRSALEMAEQRHAGESVLLVAHGAVLGAMLPIFLTNLPRARVWEIGLTHTTLIEVSSVDGQRACVRWNNLNF